MLLALGRRNLTQFKSVLFGEMAKRFSLEKEAELFWQDERTRAKLGRWFFDRPRDLPIVIASASPEFELQYAAKILGVPRLIGTKCDAETGALIGEMLCVLKDEGEDAAFAYVRALLREEKQNPTK